MESLRDCMHSPKLERKQCPDCGSMCSTTAEACWNCGYLFINNESDDGITDASLAEELWLREKDVMPVGGNIYLPSDITAGNIWGKIEEELNAHTLLHEIIKRAWISCGSILNRHNIPCFVIRHPRHRYDWLGFCIVRRAIGDTACISIYTCGNSKQMKKEVYLQNTRIFDGHAAGNAALGMLRGGAVGAGFAAGSLIGGVIHSGAKAIGKGITRLTMDYGALEQEKLWYDLVIASLQRVFFGEDA